MAAKISVLGLILSSLPDLRSVMVRFPLPKASQEMCSEQLKCFPVSIRLGTKPFFVNSEILGIQIWQKKKRKLGQILNRDKTA